MERGNTKHGPAHDDQMAREIRGMTRGSAQWVYADEWREPEPVENSVPPLARRPPGRDAQDVLDRSELARGMTRDIFPATRETLLRRLAAADAPADLVDRVGRLTPGRRFGGVHEVLEALGIASPETRLRGGLGGA